MVLVGDSLEVLKDFPDNSIDAVVTDPPYGLSFMGKKWDYDVPNVELWREVFRVLKPGGHLLSFGGTRTYHRLVVAIEDAGFEIRDQIQWIYGSGFPKSHNIKDGDFKGWGTALKPANEPICVARKPLEKGLTVSENVLKYGTGAINIDECRIGFSENETDSRIGTSTISKGSEGKAPFGEKKGGKAVQMYKEGRWPANVIFDEDAASRLGEPSRFFYVAKASKRERNAGLEGMPEKEKKTLGDYVSPSEGRTASKSGSAMQNFHPTVKPLKLMEYLIKLVTPPKGIVLDPFLGSGTTGVAAKSLGFEFVGIEMNPEYAEIAEKRIKA